MFLAFETSSKIPQQMGLSGGTHQKQLLQFFLSEGDELSPSPWTGFRLFIFFIRSKDCSDVAWLISIKQWSLKKTTTWICPFTIAHASVEQSEATTRMNGWMLFPLNQHRSCRSRKYCNAAFVIIFSVLFCSCSRGTQVMLLLQKNREPLVPVCLLLCLIVFPWISRGLVPKQYIVFMWYKSPDWPKLFFSTVYWLSNFAALFLADCLICGLLTPSRLKASAYCFILTTRELRLLCINICKVLTSIKPSG